MDRHTLTDYQRGVLAGLTIGAPAVARLYRVICERPGVTQAEAGRLAGDHTGQLRHRIYRLEKAGVITTRLELLPTRTPSKRTQQRCCYPVETP